MQDEVLAAEEMTDHRDVGRVPADEDESVLGAERGG